MAFLVSATALADGPCDHGDFAGCDADLNAKINGERGVTNVKDWQTVNSIASAYWFLTQLDGGYAVYASNSRTHNFLIGVDAKTISKELRRGMTLLQSVQCVKHLKDVTVKPDGFPVQVKLYKQVACE